MGAMPEKESLEQRWIREHEERVNRYRGRVMLFGYPSELYDQTLSGRTRYDRKIDNKVSGASKKRKMTESLWCNF